MIYSTKTIGNNLIVDFDRKIHRQDFRNHVREYARWSDDVTFIGNTFACKTRLALDEVTQLLGGFVEVYKHRQRPTAKRVKAKEFTARYLVERVAMNEQHVPSSYDKYKRFLAELELQYGVGFDEIKLLKRSEVIYDLMNYFKLDYRDFDAVFTLIYGA